MEKKKEKVNTLKEKKKMKYRCGKHLSNQGYIDDEGKWHCWFCYYENLYLNPNGVVIKELEIKDYIIRIVDRTNSQSKDLCVELFTKDKKILDHRYNCRDLSMAIRHFDNLIREILEGMYKKRGRKEAYITEERAEEDRPQRTSSYITIPSSSEMVELATPSSFSIIDESTAGSTS